MTKRRLGLWGVGLLAILVIPFSIAGSADQAKNQLLPSGVVPPEYRMPLPQGQFDAGINADTFADRRIVCPEVIWAPATGGGTWVSEIQITDRAGGAVVSGYYYYAGGSVTFSSLVTGLTYGQAARFSNILSTIASMTGATTYGTVGTLYLYTQDDSHPIMVDVETTNGNYGKSFPGVRWSDDNSINMGRAGIIQNMTNTSTWRTFVGGWNGASGGWTMVVRFYVLTPTGWSYYGNFFDKTVSAWDFTSFNPFVEAGISAYSLDGCRLYAVVQSADPSPYEKGMFLFGSKANNITNDTSALFYRRW
jgi:hypothetical protein